MATNVYTANSIATLLMAEARLPAPEAVIRTFAYDSRKLTNNSYALFCTLKARRDGMQFLADAYEKGVSNFLIDKAFKEESEQYHDANFIFVDDPLAALQQLAAQHRQQFDYPVIGITGSNGKTIVKEWLFQLLSPDYHIVRSPKSYNSQLGVALSLLNMRAAHNLAIIEAGISKVGEMAALASMIAPSIGVLTTIGHAHDEGFESLVQKTQEKLSLFKRSDLVIYNPDQLYPASSLSLKRQVTWGNSLGVNVQLLGIEKAYGKGSKLSVYYNSQPFTVQVPLEDPVAIENSMCCIAVMLALGYEPETIKQRILLLHAMEMRLTLKNGINNCSIIDDSYSNDLTSLSMALDFLGQQRQHIKHVVVLSDLPLQPNEDNAYHELMQLLEERKLNLLVGVGQKISSYLASFNGNAIFFPDTLSLISALPELNIENAAILIKGARVFRFEEVSKALTLQCHDTRMEIDLNALEHNLNQFRALLKPKTKLMVMVKAFSYGSGSYEIANVLQFSQVDYLAVAFADEGATLRRNGITLPIMVMAPDASNFELIVQHHLEPEIYDMYLLKQFLIFLATKSIKGYPIHIKVNTGMNRLGFSPGDAESLCDIIGANPLVQIQSVFSHLAASSSEEHDAFTKKQIDCFTHFADRMSANLAYPFIRHIANTAAINRFPTAQMDMVRLGIGLYGVPMDEAQTLALNTVIRVKSSITQIHAIRAGESVGYNRKGRMHRNGKIAVVKIGYADGYSRRFGNGVGKMMINGSLVPTIGDICMDMCMLDVTGLSMNEGDEVVVFGDEPAVMDLAKAVDTIPYELLTGISQRVRRVYFYE